jgi:hypothetical protein
MVIVAPDEVRKSWYPSPRAVHETWPGAWPRFGSNARGRLNAVGLGVAANNAGLTMAKHNVIERERSLNMKLILLE